MEFTPDSTFFSELELLELGAFGMTLWWSCWSSWSGALPNTPLITKFLNLRKTLFTFIRLAQKCESPLFHWTCTRGLVPRYLLRMICCQVLYVVNRRYSHLLSKAMFFNSKFCILSPPWSFGWHRIFYLASRYFCFCSSHCQKNVNGSNLTFCRLPLESQRRTSYIWVGCWEQSW